MHASTWSAAVVFEGGPCTHGGRESPGVSGRSPDVTLRGRGTPWGGLPDGVLVAYACSPASVSPAWIKRSARPASGASLDLSKGHLTT
jgi:hypothetical protein